MLGVGMKYLRASGCTTYVSKGLSMAVYLRTKQNIAIVIGLALLIVVASVGLYGIATNKNTQSGLGYGTNSPNGLQNGADKHVDITPPSEFVLNSTSVDTKNNLLYLIEEEKLAYDVYFKMYEKYGARVFGNIFKSEDNHQSRVLSLLVARGISDPRSESVGVFKNPNLQKLYFDLIARGNQSLSEAYKVGVAIEELDIADIKDNLAKLDAAQIDIKITLDSLLAGSENHLRAFNRQVR